jgi:hypothetical protein
VFLCVRQSQHLSAATTGRMFRTIAAVRRPALCLLALAGLGLAAAVPHLYRERRLWKNARNSAAAGASAMPP